MDSEETDSNFNKLVEQYEILAAEYKKIKGQNAVLKKAVIQEQGKVTALRDALDHLEKELREKVEENDSLAFNNRRLEKRVTQLILELEEQKEKKSNSGDGLFGSILSSSAKGELGRTKKQLEVMQEELEAKIKENETLHIQIFEMRQSHEHTLSTMSEKLNEVENAIQQRETQLEDLQRETERTVEKCRTEEQVLSDELSRLRQELDIRTENERTMAQLTREMQKEVESAREFISRKIFFDDTRNTLFNSLNLPPHNREALSARIDSYERVHGLTRQLCRAFDSMFSAGVDKFSLLSRNRTFSQLPKVLKSRDRVLNLTSTHAALAQNLLREFDCVLEHWRKKQITAAAMNGGVSEDLGLLTPRSVESTISATSDSESSDLSTRVSSDRILAETQAYLRLRVALLDFLVFHRKAVKLIGICATEELVHPSAGGGPLFNSYRAVKSAFGKIISAIEDIPGSELTLPDSEIVLNQDLESFLARLPSAPLPPIPPPLLSNQNVPTPGSPARSVASHFRTPEDSPRAFDMTSSAPSSPARPPLGHHHQHHPPPPPPPAHFQPSTAAIPKLLTPAALLSQQQLVRSLISREDLFSELHSTCETFARALSSRISAQQKDVMTSAGIKACNEKLINGLAVVLTGLGKLSEMARSHAEQSTSASIEIVRGGRISGVGVGVGDLSDDFQSISSATVPYSPRSETSLTTTATSQMRKSGNPKKLKIENIGSEENNVMEICVNVMTTRARGYFSTLNQKFSGVVEKNIREGVISTFADGCGIPYLEALENKNRLIVLEEKLKMAEQTLLESSQRKTEAEQQLRVLQQRLSQIEHSLLTNQHLQSTCEQILTVLIERASKEISTFISQSASHLPQNLSLFLTNSSEDDHQSPTPGGSAHSATAPPSARSGVSKSQPQSRIPQPSTSTSTLKPSGNQISSSGLGSGRQTATTRAVVSTSKNNFSAISRENIPGESELAKQISSAGAKANALMQHLNSAAGGVGSGVGGSNQNQNRISLTQVDVFAEQIARMFDYLYSELSILRSQVSRLRNHYSHFTAAAESGSGVKSGGGSAPIAIRGGGVGVGKTKQGSSTNRASPLTNPPPSLPVTSSTTTTSQSSIEITSQNDSVVADSDTLTDDDFFASLSKGPSEPTNATMKSQKKSVITTNVSKSENGKSNFQQETNGGDRMDFLNSPSFYSPSFDDLSSQHEPPTLTRSSTTISGVGSGVGVGVSKKGNTNFLDGDLEPLLPSTSLLYPDHAASAASELNSANSALLDLNSSYPDRDRDHRNKENGFAGWVAPKFSDLPPLPPPPHSALIQQNGPTANVGVTARVVVGSSDSTQSGENMVISQTSKYTLTVLGRSSTLTDANEWKATHLPKDVADREKALAQKFEAQVKMLTQQIKLADAKALDFYMDWQSAVLELEEYTSHSHELFIQLEQARELLNSTQEELETTRNGYDKQIETLTENLCTVGKQMNEFEAEAHHLKEAQVFCGRCKQFNQVGWLVHEGQNGRRCRWGPHLSGYNYA